MGSPWEGSQFRELALTVIFPLVSLGLYSSVPSAPISWTLLTIIHFSLSPVAKRNSSTSSTDQGMDQGFVSSCGSPYSAVPLTSWWSENKQGLESNDLHQIIINRVPGVAFRDVSHPHPAFARDPLVPFTVC